MGCLEVDYYIIEVDPEKQVKKSSKVSVNDIVIGEVEEVIKVDGKQFVKLILHEKEVLLTTSIAVVQEDGTIIILNPSNGKGESLQYGDTLYQPSLTPIVIPDGYTEPTLESVPSTEVKKVEMVEPSSEVE